VFRIHVGRQHLDRDAPIELRVDGEVHNTHPTTSELTLDAIAPADDSCDTIGIVHPRSKRVASKVQFARPTATGLFGPAGETVRGAASRFLGQPPPDEKTPTKYSYLTVDPTDLRYPDY
jgi:hypothetical protein